ncbi:hypothetical protein [Polaromonas sp. JS666]|uniref:hypothetical protein n=1 Tax=Polaromonas sp. (strain JS666 / ATCC BAA-500) TaxID=296591 RepID=UPI00059C2DFB|nr:hypothetical protein [Polaromonas sp. JS666]
MRDDLHHSLPQTSLWRAAVKAACSPGWDGTLRDAITRAVWASGAAWWDTAWEQELRALLTAKEFDMFGQERLERSLVKLENTSPDHSAQRVCEIARAVILNAEPSLNLYKQVIHSALETHAEDCFEHVAARIEAEHPEYQAREVRRRMRAELPSCNLSEPPAPKPRQRRKSVEQALDMALPTNF